MNVVHGVLAYDVIALMVDSLASIYDDAPS